MRVYLILCRLGWPRSYVGKFLLVSFLGVHVPLIGAVLYLLTMADLTTAAEIGVLVALLLATVVGCALTMASLYALLAPIREAARAIKGYLREKQVPQLPTQIGDDAGVLMANIQEGIIRLDAALDAAHSKLTESEESTKGRFGLLSAMSHELRTPLNHIIGFAEVMATEALGPLGQPNYRGYATNITESGGHLLTTLQTMLELSEVAAGSIHLRPQAIAVAEHIHCAVALVHLHAQAASIRMQVDASPAIRVLADQRSLKQILLHVLQSTIDTSQPGQGVSIIVDRQDDKIVVETVQYNPAWTVDDIPLELRGTLKGLRPYAGDGVIASVTVNALRLSLIRALALANGGSFTLHDGPYEARILRLALPAAASAAPALAVA